MGLRALAKVQKLQTALHAKAKEEPGLRFHALYDKVYREDVLAHAYRLAKANGGAAGIDGQRFPDIEDYQPVDKVRCGRGRCGSRRGDSDLIL